MAQNYFPTAQGLIDVALGCIRAVDPESSVTPNATQRSNALTALNLIVTSWQALGMQVWCTKTATLTLVNNQNNYALGTGGDLVIARPLSVSQAWLHDLTQNTDPIPVRMGGREEYNSWTTKAANSPPYFAWYDPTYDVPGSNSGATEKGMLHVYPTPGTTEASTYTLQFVYTRPIQDFAALSDSVDFPQEWYNAVKWNLAHQIAFDYGVPVLYLDRIKAIADDELNRVSGWDHETGSMFVYPAKN